MMFRIVGPTGSAKQQFNRPLDDVETSQRVDVARRSIDAALTRATLADIDAVLARFPIECRSTAVTETVDVDKVGRTIRLIAVPYEAPTQVVFRGQMWSEVFSRGAFDDIGGRNVRVNRGHDRGRTVGRVVAFDTTDHRGLVADLRIARTALGDETLALAAEDCLSASIGFSVPAGGEQLDYRSRARRVNRAILDHVALVEDPAYTGAAILGVG